MEKQIKQVVEFHKKFGLPVRNTVNVPATKEFMMRHGLIKEELKEIMEGYKNNDSTEMVDGIVDLLYVTIGLAVQMGVADKLEQCFDEVQRSNMTKLGEDGKPVLREDGKILKGENYSPPNLIKILKP